jgi:hypothetical protein
LSEADIRFAAKIRLPGREQKIQNDTLCVQQNFGLLQVISP